MAKVFPLFLVILVLAASVLLFAIPTQEQPANAYVNGDTDIMQYQMGDYTAFINIPYELGFGYKFQFDVNTGSLPFELCFIALADVVLQIELEYFSGVLSLSSPVPHFNFDIEYNTLMPFRLELFVGPYHRNMRLIININTENVVNTYYVYSEYFDEWSILFNKFNDIYNHFEPYSYSYWDSPPAQDLAVFYTACYLNPRSVYTRDWVDGGAGYDAGYIDGMNEANNAKVNLFPSLIGSIFAFFMSIASYEVLGISLLNIMIIVGSVLLLLAILRIFLK